MLQLPVVDPFLEKVSFSDLGEFYATSGNYFSAFYFLTMIDLPRIAFTGERHDDDDDDEEGRSRDNFSPAQRATRENHP